MDAYEIRDHQLPGIYRKSLPFKEIRFLTGPSFVLKSTYAPAGQRAGMILAETGVQKLDWVAPAARLAVHIPLPKRAKHNN
jgi:hypothetical protein